MVELDPETMMETDRTDVAPGKEQRQPSKAEKDKQLMISGVLRRNSSCPGTHLILVISRTFGEYSYVACGNLFQQDEEITYLVIFTHC